MTTNTTTRTRSQELTDALATVERELKAARAALGLAVADDNISGAKQARAEVERLEKIETELRSAIPICRQREEAARRAAEEKAQRERERQANAARKARVAAAKKVDAALRSLGKAYTEYLATSTGGRPQDANRLARRSRHAIAAATFHAAPEFAAAMDPHRRPPRMHWHPLACAVEGTVGEFAEVEDAEA